METDDPPCHLGGMTAYEGFRFEFSRPDVNLPGSEHMTQIIVVAPSYDAALAAAKDMVGGLGNLRLLDHGDTVLEEARRLGIPDGQARVL